jgi:hypothetical protein
MFQEIGDNPHIFGEIVKITILESDVLANGPEIEVVLSNP